MVNEKIIPGYNISMEEFSAICLESYNTKLMYFLTLSTLSTDCMEYIFSVRNDIQELI